MNSVIGVPLYPSIHHINTTVELIRVPTYLASMRLITFFKQLPEFHLLQNDDRVTLIKYNILAIVFLHTVLIYDPILDTYHEHNTNDPIFEGKDWINTISEEFHQQMIDVTIGLIKILECDRIMLKLLLIILLFSKGFCSYDPLNEPILNDSSSVLNAQNVYLDLLYRYSLHQYGEQKTTKLFSRLIAQLINIQHLAKDMKTIVHDHVLASQLSPLMQSVMQFPDSAMST